ncbi:MAG: selenocysteine-specific translation elongation factor [Promethearchaeota archaeon Loki_b32]|nr:MAG: selenocysteine-specific translation elongation factor [Candidatus Lokiarchaeota archaeon Loki_b32]
MENEKKIPIHIGLFGHIDSGKTKIASVLSEIISTAGLDAHPQSKERGITIDLGFTSFLLDKYLITLVDGPGHADLIKISASSAEIIDCALVVIDINKGPQVQTGEHLILIESLKINKIIVVINKIDIFSGDIDEELKKIREFFGSTSFGYEVPIFAVSAKEKAGFEELKNGILETINSFQIERNTKGDIIIPIDHHFPIKGMGAILTGTILSGILKVNQNLEVIPVKTSGRVKSIQIFHQNVDSANAGDRVGINIKGLDLKKIYRGCYATNNPNAFDYCNVFEVKVNNNKLFKPKTGFGTQIHITIGMVTTTGNVYPFYDLDGKLIQTTASNKNRGFRAIILLKEKVLIRKEKHIMLLSRLDLPPTTLRILGSAELLKIYEEPPVFYKYKTKKGVIKNPDHPQGIVCLGLAQSATGAKKIVGKSLEPPFTKILDTFGTKGAIIVGISDNEKRVKKGDPVFLKELRNFRLKNI